MESLQAIHHPFPRTSCAGQISWYGDVKIDADPYRWGTNKVDLIVITCQDQAQFGDLNQYPPAGQDGG